MIVSVPATSANLGPGFDTLGLAINLRNKVKIKPSKFKGYKGVYEYKDGNVYKYFYGKETDYAKIETLYKEVKKKFKDSFPVAFVNGKKTSVREAKALLK